MGRLVYSALCSLDGYTVDVSGDFSWCAPDEEVHAFVNDLTRPLGTYLYGRRMYEVMRYWEEQDPDGSGVTGDFTRLWQAADKVVFSRSLETVSTKRTRLENAFDAECVRELVASAASDVGIGGPHLATQSLQRGLVHEVQLLRFPMIVGSGTRALPDVRMGLSLLDTHRFAGGVTFASYRVTS